MSTRHTKSSKNIVPKLDLRNLGSNSAPNSNRSEKKDNFSHKGCNSISKLNDIDPKYLAWKRRKEYKPSKSSKKMPLRMTKSLTVDNNLCYPIVEGRETSYDDNTDNHNEITNIYDNDELSELDQLVIDTSLNISNKLCLAAKQVVAQTAVKFPVDGELMENMETLCYVLDDTQHSSDTTSSQLAGLLRNMKKMEQAINLTETIINSKQ